MTTLLLFAAASVLVLLPGALSRYRSQLPAAPACPGCRAMTIGCPEVWLFTHVLPSLADTVRRECTRCGWRGRMRLRLAPEGAHGS
jgi:hypothetical protein